MKEEFDVLIKSEELQDISIDIVEKALDSQLSDEVLREIPIVKSLIASLKIYNSISDRFFIKKAMHVLLELKDVGWKERIELTRDLDDEYGSGAEKILFAVDRLDSLKKCRVLVGYAN